jgi:hypothetical protein
MFNLLHAGVAAIVFIDIISLTPELQSKLKELVLEHTKPFKQVSDATFTFL